mmetsp:Transcript_56805/g.122819  ORF Transcript_56805/g.122819 Transcript_56805/m.122819 type:complete len:298 (-) Transcript_56805:76-969(-)
MARGLVALPLLAIVATGWVCWCIAATTFSAPPSGVLGRRPGSGAIGASTLSSGSSRVAAAPSRTAVAARGGDDEEEEEDYIQLGGFSGFVVGLGLLPHAVFTFATAVGIALGTAQFSFGPFGLYLISFGTSIGLTLWSLGSFVQRGRGLPAGPLGVLGLSEGISYLASIGIVIAFITSAFRGVSLPSLPKVDMPEMNAPAFQAPSFDFKAPDVKVPNFKAPDFKTPDFKTPEFNVKVPDMPKFKAPDMKMPDMKMPEMKMPEMPKAKSDAQPESKSSFKMPNMPKMPDLPDYDQLFD